MARRFTSAYSVRRPSASSGAGAIGKETTFGTMKPRGYIAPGFSGGGPCARYIAYIKEHHPADYDPEMEVIYEGADAEIQEQCAIDLATLKADDEDIAKLAQERDALVAQKEGGRRRGGVTQTAGFEGRVQDGRILVFRKGAWVPRESYKEPEWHVMEFKDPPSNTGVWAAVAVGMLGALLIWG